MIYTKEQLILNGEYFFKNANVKSMLGTVDGQYFYPENKSDMDAYVKTSKIEWVSFNRNDIEKLKAPKIEKIEVIKKAPIMKKDNSKKLKR